MQKSGPEKLRFVTDHLSERARKEFLPGSRFLTNREVSCEYEISYVTAHKIIDRLCANGILERHSTNGTFIPGKSFAYEKAHLIFHPVASKEGRFGEALLRELRNRLDQQSIPWKLSWANQRIASSKRDYHILWERERDSIVRELSVTGRHGLLLNQPPPASTLHAFDSVRIDYFAAGMQAGELLRSKRACKRTTILGNPPGKIRSAEAFTRGFRAVWPGARFVNVRYWEKPADPEILRRLTEHKEMGICCCTIPRAVELMRYCAQQRLNASLIVASAEPPRAPELTMPYVTVPLNNIVAAALRIIRNRFAGDASCPTHITLEPR